MCISCLACALTVQGQALGYKTIEWFVLMSLQWFKVVTQNFDALYNLPILQDASAQETNAIRILQNFL
jgi:hypothetical protein